MLVVVVSAGVTQLLQAGSELLSGHMYRERAQTQVVVRLGMTD
jgi:hypothetical protein